MIPKTLLCILRILELRNYSFSVENVGLGWLWTHNQVFKKLLGILEKYLSSSCFEVLKKVFISWKHVLKKVSKWFKNHGGSFGACVRLETNQPVNCRRQPVDRHLTRFLSSCWQRRASRLAQGASQLGAYWRVPSCWQKEPIQLPWGAIRLVTFDLKISWLTRDELIDCSKGASQPTGVNIIIWRILTLFSLPIP